jgi:adenylate cyclase class 2
MQNVEYKAELRDIELARSICRAIKAELVATLEQTDTYYRVADARLKKRETVGLKTEYIFYQRSNVSGPRISGYVVYSEQEALLRFGTTPMPVWVVVKKTRELYTLGNVRIHLDMVEGLGRFLEFEAVVSAQHDVANCHAAVHRLKLELAPVLGEPISASYSDLVAAE